MVLRVLLLEERLDGMHDDGIFLIGGEEYQEPAHAVAEGGSMDGQLVFFIVEQGDEGKEYYICDGSQNQDPDSDVDDM